MKKVLLLVGAAVLLVVVAVISTILVVDPGKLESAPEPAVVAPAPAADAATTDAEDAEATDDAQADDEPAAASENAVYHEFYPNFVVNINDVDKNRFLAIDLAAVVEDQAAVDALKNHMPAIRNDLIMLFSSQDASALRTTEGKEALRRQTLAAVRKVMEQKYGEPAVQDIYFNKFVIQ